MDSMLGAPKTIQWRPLITMPLCESDKQAKIKLFSSEILRDQYLRAGPAVQPLDRNSAPPKRIDYFFSSKITLYDDSDSPFGVRGTISPMGEPIYIDNPAFLLSFSSLNAGHTQSELIYFLNYIKKTITTKDKISLFVCKCIQEDVSLVFELLSALATFSIISIIDPDKTYFFKELQIVKVGRYVGLPWDRTQKVALISKGSYFEVKRDRDFYTEYTTDPRFVCDYAESVALTKGYRYELFEKVIFVKMKSAELMCSPERAMIIDPDVQEYLKGKGYKFLKLSDMTCLEHLLCVLGNAKKAITSYGNIACSNRFYYSKDCSLILLANKSYRREYSFKGHIVHSHIFPVAYQCIAVDFPDRPKVQDFIPLQGLL